MSRSSIEDNRVENESKVLGYEELFIKLHDRLPTETVYKRVLLDLPSATGS